MACIYRFNNVFYATEEQAWARGKGEGGGKRAFFPFLSGTLLGLVFSLSLSFEGFWLLEKKVDQDTLIFCFLPSPGSEPGVLQ